MNSSIGLQDRLAKQNKISRQKLARELVKLEKVEKSDLRMIETARHRFRSRHKKLEVPQPSELNAINVRMYETHNPGFCYHCTGAIKESGSSKKEETHKDSYELAHSLIFTNGKVDPDKILCLHLLAAHSTRWNDDDDSTVRPVTALLEKAKKKHFTGAWNNVLPCYVINVRQSHDGRLSENFKLHENPEKQNMDDQAIQDFERRYKQYMENNADFSSAMSANAKQTRIAPSGLGKMPIISPHVYSLLGASHELKIKQALIDSSVRRKFDRSSMELSVVDEASLSFHLDDDKEAFSKMTTNVSTRKWDTKSTRSPSMRSGRESLFKFDHRITMLKSKYGKPINQFECKTKNYEPTPNELITIKSSFRTVREVPSRSSSTKSPFHDMFERRFSTSSFLSGTLSPESAVKKCRKCIYLNSPIKCIELQDKEYKTVPILVNYQIEALVQSVLEVLNRVNPQKMRKIIEVARNPEEIKQVLSRPETQKFVHSLLGQSLISSPESFVVSAATVTNEIDYRFEGILQKEIIALTLEVPSFPSLNAVITEVRDNIFFDEKKKRRSTGNTKETPYTSGEKNKQMACNTREFSNEINPDNKIAARMTLPDKKLSGTDTVTNINECCENEKFEFLGKGTITSNVYKLNAMFQPPSAVETKKMNTNCPGRKLSKQKEIVENTTAISQRNNRKNLEKRESSNHESRDKEEKMSGSSLNKRTSNMKSWKMDQDVNYLDADHTILRRMTNNQRILVGQMCASLKTKRINNEGLINERMPLAALITPALSRESIKFLTRGTAYSKAESLEKHKENVENTVVVPDKLTGPVLAKIRQDVAENETKHRLKCFLDDKSK